MKVVVDGLFILIKNWELILFILSLIVVSQYTIQYIVKRLVDQPLSSGEYFSIAAGGWLLLASFLSLLWYLLKSIQASLVDVFFIICIILTVILLYYQQKKIDLPEPELITWILPVLLGVFIILRLAYVSNALLPSYFDSAQHYLYIRQLTEGPGLPGTGGFFNWLGKNYYHLGFHLITAWITASLKSEIAATMLIMGQIILAVTPISVFFLVRHETGSNSAGIFAVLLAGIGWYMPAHAVDWGKYPAVASLPLIQFVLSIAYISLQQKKKEMLNMLILSGILISTFFHSRSLMVFGIALLAWMMAAWRKKLPRMVQSIVILIPMIGIIFLSILIQQQDILKPLLDPYLNKGFLITALILALLFFAIKFYPSLTFICLVGVFLLIGSIFIPVTGLAGYKNTTLLDRPFVEMILYLPLSMLGGLGLAGLYRYIQQNTHAPFEKIIGIIFIGAVVVHAYINYDFYPSDCCTLVGFDDLTAIDWMDKNLPTKARILISTGDLVLVSSTSSQGRVGTDAGIWITPLTGRPTFPAPYNLDFSRRETLDFLCKKKINHIYVGEIGQPFDDIQLGTQTTWYKALLVFPKARVYQVIGCK